MRVFIRLLCLLLFFSMESKSQITLPRNLSVPKPMTPVDPLLQKMTSKAIEKNLGNPEGNTARLLTFYTGYIVRFERGFVYYSESSGIHAVSKQMDEGTFSERGFPLSEEVQDGSNRFQVFERMVKYYSLENTTVRNWDFKQAAYTGIAAPEIAKRSGNYKFTLLGFTCNHPTNDDILERDGKGDEVYITCNGYYQHADQSLTSTISGQTKVHGDVNNPAWIVGPDERIRVGSKSSLGGIKEGDSYPAVPYQLNTALHYPEGNNPLKIQIPFQLLQFHLIEDGDKVVFIPVIWEKDNNSEPFNDFLYFLSVPGVSDFVNYVAGNANDAILHSGDNTRPQLNYMHDILFNFRDVNNGSQVTVKKSIVGDPHDRPVGMHDAGDRFGFNPIAVKIGYKEAEQLVNSNPLGVGNGIFKIDYIDDPALAGSYTLYFKIEKFD